MAVVQRLEVVSSHSTPTGKSAHAPCSRIPTLLPETALAHFQVAKECAHASCKSTFLFGTQWLLVLTMHTHVNTFSGCSYVAFILRMLNPFTHKI